MKEYLEITNPADVLCEGDICLENEKYEEAIRYFKIVKKMCEPLTYKCSFKTAADEVDRESKKNKPITYDKKNVSKEEAVRWRNIAFECIANISENISSVIQDGEILKNIDCASTNSKKC